MPQANARKPAAAWYLLSSAVPQANARKPAAAWYLLFYSVFHFCALRAQNEIQIRSEVPAAVRPEPVEGRLGKRRWPAWFDKLTTGSAATRGRRSLPAIPYWSETL